MGIYFNKIITPLKLNIARYHFRKKKVKSNVEIIGLEGNEDKTDKIREIDIKLELEDNISPTNENLKKSKKKFIKDSTKHALNSNENELNQKSSENKQNIISRKLDPYELNNLE